MKNFFTIVFAFILMTVTGCFGPDCSLADCRRGTYIQLAILQNGQNILEQENVPNISITMENDDANLSDTLNNTIVFTIVNGLPLQLTIEESVFSITTEGNFMGDECCSSYFVENLFIDGVAICSGSDCYGPVTLSL